MSISDNILIQVETAYVAAQSNPDKNRYVFSYTITIINQSNDVIKLISRHWLIKDSNYRIEEVIGEGVVGEQPLLKPHQGFQYSSG
ncbi:MAG: Co2+/Mg2+ efflux protein ApaG, partial [Arenicella sp.]